MDRGIDAELTAVTQVHSYTYDNMKEMRWKGRLEGHSKIQGVKLGCC